MTYTPPHTSLTLRNSVDIPSIDLLVDAEGSLCINSKSLEINGIDIVDLISIIVDIKMGNTPSILAEWLTCPDIGKRAFATKIGKLLNDSQQI